jgi:hypothetical protein
MSTQSVFLRLGSLGTTDDEIFPWRYTRRDDGAAPGRAPFPGSLNGEPGVSASEDLDQPPLMASSGQAVGQKPAQVQPKLKGTISLERAQGMLVDNRVHQREFSHIEHGDLKVVHAIVVHQTDGGSAQAAFNSYSHSKAGTGAHFLIDKDGTIYQTASLNKRCYHVGRLIRSKCLTIDRKTCSDSANIAKILAMSWTQRLNALNKYERAKDYPARYPVNSDSIGIELVGRHIDDKTFEAVTPAQNASLQWLIGELFKRFSLTEDDVYRHPEISYKNPGEAGSAQWKQQK